MEARRLLVKAMDLDPQYARAYMELSWAHLQSWQFGWSTDPGSLERARELAERAIALDDTLVAGHSLLGQIYLGKKEHNFIPAHAYLAVVLAEMGREKEAREAWAKASQLSPGVSLAGIRERLPYRRPADLDRFLTAANRAGLH